MSDSEGLRLSDSAVVARYLNLRSFFHDGILARVESAIEERYRVQTTHRLSATLVSLVRAGFSRILEGEIWPVVFLSPVDISLALCVQIRPERLASLGTTVKGPQRIRHRPWDDWWGWEVHLDEVRPQFYDLKSPEQDEALVAWYLEQCEWLAQNKLMQRK